MSTSVTKTSETTTTTTTTSKQKLRTSIDVYNRLKWDTDLPINLENVYIIYQDKHHKQSEVVFHEFLPIEQGGDIPFHRILQFRHGHALLWDRARRIDNVFKNSGVATNPIHPSNTFSNNNNNNNNNNNSDSNTTSTTTSINTDNTETNTIDLKQFIRDVCIDSSKYVQLYNRLNDCIRVAYTQFQCNIFENFARHLCYNYFGQLPSVSTSQYALFGSSLLGLDTHNSDLDVTILSNSAKIDANDKTSCVHFLQQLMKELQTIEPLNYSFQNKKSHTTEPTTTTKSNEAWEFSHSNSLLNLDRKQYERILSSKHNIDKVIVKHGHMNVVSDASIPKAVLTFDVRFMQGSSQLWACHVSMDVTVSPDKEVLWTRNQQLFSWMQGHCLETKDKRIHQYLFVVKLWSQHYRICRSDSSTINGYGWMHIALFVLFRLFKKSPSLLSMGDNDKTSAKYVYPDVYLPEDISPAYLFLQFLKTMYEWLGSEGNTISSTNQKDATKQSRSINRKGMDIISGEWIDNPRRYALYVVDPFAVSQDNDNLAKCVRNRGGVPSIKSAVTLSVTGIESGEYNYLGNLLFGCKIEGEEEKEKEKEIKTEQEETKEKKEKKEEEEEEEESSNKIIEQNSWTLEKLQLLEPRLPERQWIGCMENQISEGNPWSFRIGTFNCLADCLTKGGSPQFTFKCDGKYLQFEYRFPRLLREILDKQCDIVCLQEIDHNLFDDYWFASMKLLGYSGIYLRKNIVEDVVKSKIPMKKQKKMKKRHEGPSDGCAIFWNDKFEEVCHEKVILNKKGPNNALLVRLKAKQKSDFELDVWTTHLKAGRNLMCENWRLKQVENLVEAILAYSMNRCMILCGDLNSSHKKEQDVDPTVYPSLLSQNKILLTDIYRDNGIELEYTHYTAWMDRIIKCNLDYILLGEWPENNYNQENIKSSKLVVEKLLDVWDIKKVNEFDSKLPNACYPSDHMLLCAQLSVY